MAAEAAKNEAALRNAESILGVSIDRSTVDIPYPRTWPRFEMWGLPFRATTGNIWVGRECTEVGFTDLAGFPAALAEHRRLAEIEAAKAAAEEAAKAKARRWFRRR